MIDRATRIDQLAQELEEAILTGRLPRGQPLPSERRLAEGYRLSRATIRAATQRLIGKGLVVQAGGHATVVAEGPWTFDRLVERIHAHRERPEAAWLVGDLLIVRRLVLAEIAARACEGPVDIGDLSLFVNELRRHVARGSLPRMVSLVEGRLFDTLIAGCDNVALAMVAASISRLFAYFPQLIDALPSGLSVSLDAWARLPDLVQRRASAEVRGVMSDALEAADRCILAACGSAERGPFAQPQR